MTDAAAAKATKRGSRRRGREQRAAERRATKATPSTSGGFSGGAFKPLSAQEVARVHGAALEVLETIGIGDPTQELLDIVLPKGCVVGRGGRLCFPASLMEDILAIPQPDFTVFARGGRSPEWDVHIGGDKVYTAIGAEAVMILDGETRTYRQTVLRDLYDLARFADALENIHLAGQQAHLHDVEDILEQDINTIYALAAGTDKPFTCSLRNRGNIAPALELLDMIAGGAGQFAIRPFCTFGPIAVISPLRFEEDRLGMLIDIARSGLMNDASNAPMAGATAPAPLAGVLVQGTAEMLATIAVIKLTNPDCPVLFAPWPFLADLRTGAFASGSGESAVLGAAYAQMGKFYGYPTSHGAGMTDAKMPDAQAGFEKASLAMLVGQSGANRIKCVAGMLAGIKCCSLECLVTDNDLLGVVLRSIRGIEVTDETLSVETIRDVVFDTGHYLGHSQTMKFMETEYTYPSLSDRTSTDEWELAGSPSLFERARERTRKIYDSHYPQVIDPATDAAIRTKFPIHLAREDMSPKDSG